MANDRGKELQEHHNQGEKDYQEGKNNPPHCHIPLLDDLIYGSKHIDQCDEDNKAYQQGRENAQKQA